MHLLLTSEIQRQSRNERRPLFVGLPNSLKQRRNHWKNNIENHPNEITLTISSFNHVRLPQLQRGDSWNETFQHLEHRKNLRQSSRCMGSMIPVIELRQVGEEKGAWRWPRPTKPTIASMFFAFAFHSFKERGQLHWGVSTVVPWFSNAYLHIPIYMCSVITVERIHLRNRTMKMTPSNHTMSWISIALQSCHARRFSQLERCESRSEALKTLAIGLAYATVANHKCPVIAVESWMHFHRRKRTTKMTQINNLQNIKTW